MGRAWWRSQGGAALEQIVALPKKEPQMTLLLIFVYCNRGCDFKSPVNGFFLIWKKKKPWNLILNSPLLQPKPKLLKLDNMVFLKQRTRWIDLNPIDAAGSRCQLLSVVKYSTLPIWRRNIDTLTMYLWVKPTPGG